MRRIALTAAIALMAAAPMAEAQGKGNGNGNGNNRGNGNAGVAGGCPPGLAKKNPPCVPPGLAKNRDRVRDNDGEYYDGSEDVVLLYQPGEVISGDYVIITDPGHYGLDPYADYYRVGDQFYRVDEDTREVIAFVGALADLLD